MLLLLVWLKVITLSTFYSIREIIKPKRMWEMQKGVFTPNCFSINFKSFIQFYCFKVKYKMQKEHSLYFMTCFFVFPFSNNNRMALFLTLLLKGLSEIFVEKQKS
jgi:hypothetical protein